MVDLLNRDWLEYPQMRYCISQLLAGAILQVSKQILELVNTQIQNKEHNLLLSSFY